MNLKTSHRFAALVTCSPLAPAGNPRGHGGPGRRAERSGAADGGHGAAGRRALGAAGLGPAWRRRAAERRARSRHAAARRLAGGPQEGTAGTARQPAWPARCAAPAAACGVLALRSSLFHFKSRVVGLWGLLRVGLGCCAACAWGAGGSTSGVLVELGQPEWDMKVRGHRAEERSVPSQLLQSTG